MQWHSRQISYLFSTTVTYCNETSSRHRVSVFTMRNNNMSFMLIFELFTQQKRPPPSCCCTSIYNRPQFKPFTFSFTGATRPSPRRSLCPQFGLRSSRSRAPTRRIFVTWLSTFQKGSKNAQSLSLGCRNTKQVISKKSTF